MKVFICLFALIAYVNASAILHAAPAVLSTGSSQQSRTQSSDGTYAFQYNEQHSTGGSSRSEAGAPGLAQGSYTLNVADGRQRVVNYVADGLGFRAAIATNEPGTAALPAASTAISSPHLPPVAPAPVAVAPVAAPVAVAPVHHAPVLAAPVAAPVAVHAPALVHHAAPVAVHAPVVHHVPAVSSYSTAINHGVVAHAPLVHAAPVVAHAAPLLHHAPLAVAHAAPVHHAPLLGHY